MVNQYFLDRIAGRNPNIRASDAEREGTADRLRKGHAEGRLDLAEFQERLEHCYEARTLGELDALVGDLPRHDERAERESLRFSAPRRWGLASLAPLLLVLLLVSAASGHHHHVFWLWIPLLFVVWRMVFGRRRRWWA